MIRDLVSFLGACLLAILLVLTSVHLLAAPRMDRPVTHFIAVLSLKDLRAAAPDVVGWHNSLEECHQQTRTMNAQAVRMGGPEWTQAGMAFVCLELKLEAT